MKIAFNTLGCKLNQYETELIKEMAEEASFEIVNFNSNADIYVINTCSVTMSADKQSRNLIRRVRRRTKKAKIIVTGCFSKNNKNLLSKSDIYVANKDKYHFFKSFFGTKKDSINKFSNHTRAFVKIQTGCNRFCSYCIVPYLRGKESSRAPSSIINEIRTLVDNGFKEIIITGVHIGRYNFNGENLTSLLKLIENIEGLQRIRLGSLNPEEMEDELLLYISSSEKVCHHFHISLQSGSKKILKLMGRDYTPYEVAKKIEKINRLMDDCAIGADIITGFPFEGDNEFDETYNFINKLPFAYLHVFRYSLRANTLASVFPMQINEKLKKQRSAILRELGLKKSIIFRKQFIDKNTEVLIETKKDRTTDMMVGFTGNYIRVLLPQAENCGNTLKTVKIKKIVGYDTYGNIVDN
ncbi:MAG: tRNA (N(6)-L-threonylcarbamoyladenosine(37)-C(2))-methylthiotransferase MtaB [Candidatus Cloacimonas sp. 4484_209]|nr:MAG: tRNA (N(6)-L-threonylcarbamoyladenosine(37)-C(2))-methylthiotransferase MtaB [Candidatus Cloacimonas sp. 4484_209]